MSLDTPERVKYFGLRSVRACGICRLRKGRSVTRKATRHVQEDIDRLYRVANGDPHTRPRISRRKRAREKLSRHGFDRTKRCRLMQHAKGILVDIPKYKPTLYGGLIRYECMHIYYIAFCSWALQYLVACVPKKKYGDVEVMVKRCHQFRDPITGQTHPRLRSIIRLQNFTAERRVRAIFYWTHVLGLEADLIEERCRLHAQYIVSALQLILIATRGHRSYTTTELDTIFKDVGREFFVHLEALAQYADDKRVSNEQEQYERDPDSHVHPTP